MSADAAAPFAGLDESALRELAPGGLVRAYAKNVVVVSEGDATDALYVVMSGRVKAFVSDEGGREVVVNTIAAGDYFGELVLDGGLRAASIMTLEPSRMYVIAQADVEQLLERSARSCFSMSPSARSTTRPAR
jgi:CRP/FNR family cyclic AMP-dependent transcriptional regulator